MIVHVESEYVDRVKLAFDEASTGYDYYSFLQRDIASKLCKLVGAVKELDRVLDVGCGTGHVGRSIEGKCALYQLDISEKMCRIAREKNNAALTITCDMNQMAFRNEFFSAVVSSMAMHWVEDMRSALASIIRISKREGRGVFISIPVRGTFKELNICYEMLGISSKHEFHSVPSIRDMVSQVGARVEYAECEQRIVEHRTFFEFVNFLKKTGSHVPRYDSKVYNDESIKKVSSVYSSTFSNQSKIVSSWNIAYLVIKK